MMQFNVARLLKWSVGTSHRQTLDATFTPLEDTQTNRVWGQLQLIRVNEGVWVSGSLDATVTCVCSRCLQDSPLSLRFQLDEIYVSVVDITTGASLPLPEDADASLTIDEHHVLDITEAVRQSIIVALPMKPLCRADCAGICTECGANLNEASCTCKALRMDPRWIPILKLSS